MQGQEWLKFNRFFLFIIYIFLLILAEFPGGDTDFGPLSPSTSWFYFS